MLIQVRGDSLRLITQCDHALLSGQLAHQWWGLDRESSPLAFDLLMATALHDLAWVEADTRPTWNLEDGRPFDFIDYPLDERLALYTWGLDSLEDPGPYICLLTSMHYCAFKGMASVSSFQRQEEKRRQTLAQRLELDDTARSHADEQLAYLQMFDVLSLFICLTPPSANTDDVPIWLSPLKIGRTPKGTELGMRWSGDERLVFSPSPFRQMFRVSIPYRDLPELSYPDQEALDRAWAEAPVAYWTVEIC